ncbi:unnamed protein product, partial [Prorocentrum cordatum]
EHVAGEGPLRLQAPSGIYAEIRIPVQPEEPLSQDTSCAGYHAVVAVGSGRTRSLRHRTLDFRPPTGGVLCTQVTFDRDVMGELSHPRGKVREEYIEVWTKLKSGPITALELLSESPSKTTQQRMGYWLFCGDRFVRIIGPKLGDGLVAGTVCSSLRQLEFLSSSKAVRKELRTHYEACSGTIESPGVLRVAKKAWPIEQAGKLLYDAKGGSGGSVAVSKHEVTHRLPSGIEQRWRVRDWGFNPFAPSKSAREESRSPKKPKTGLQLKAKADVDAEKASTKVPAKAKARSKSQDSSASVRSSPRRRRWKKTRQKQDRHAPAVIISAPLCTLA